MTMNALPDIRWQRLKDTFNEIIELPPEDRSSFLSELRFEEKTLYEEIIELLYSEGSAEGFMQRPISVAWNRSWIDETIGPYRILREIAQGGMGTVFEARRDDGEFDQKVAIKLTDRGPFSDELVNRFFRERQILAQLEHPNIVRLLDGGVTANRLPYFVMELITGSPISGYCKDNNLDVRKRIELFLQICSAVAYAHRRLIVHRDLKPSNILVTEEGQIKLLDFGIAKILADDPNIQTRTQNAPMTPGYASPEQIKSVAITTASDIYCLGVVLYEILTGKGPEEIYEVGRVELSYGICEVDPVKPSLCGSNDPSAIRPELLRGDLDNIVLRALQKEPENRYISVEQFAEDLQAYLDGFPVKAHPESLLYRAQKFARRRRSLVLLSAASIILVAGGVILAAWQYTNAQQQRRIAEQNFKQVRKIANSLILDYYDAISKLEGSTELREKLVVDAVNYLDAISSENTNDPEFLKELAVAYRRIGAAQGMPFAANLGKTEAAVKSYEKSVNLLERAAQIAPNDLSLKDELRRSYNEMGQAVTRTGVDGGSIFQKAVKISEELIKLNPDDLESRIYHVRLKMYTAGQHKTDLENFEDYIRIINEASELHKNYPNNIDIVAILARANESLGNAYRGRGNQTEKEPDGAERAKRLYESAVGPSEESLKYMQMRQALDPSDGNNRRRIFAANTNLAAVMGYLNRFEEAEYYQAISEKIVRELREKDSSNKETILDEITVYKNRFNLLEKQNKTALAVQKAKAAIAILEEYCRFDPKNAEALGWLGVFYNKLIIFLEGKKMADEARVYRRHYEALRVDYERKFNRAEDFNSDGGR